MPMVSPRTLRVLPRAIPRARRSSLVAAAAFVADAGGGAGTTGGAQAVVVARPAEPAWCTTTSTT